MTTRVQVAPRRATAAATLRALRSVEAPTPDGGRTRLRLVRAWPRREGRLACEFHDPQGRLVAGQWFSRDGSPDSDRLERIRRSTALTGAPVSARADLGLLLQHAGADRRLPALARLVERPGATLAVHRPERRAVVRIGNQTATGAWFRVLRPGSTLPVVQAAETVRRWVLDAATPRLLAHDPVRGVTAWSHVAGTSLRTALGSAAVGSDQAEALGSAVRAVHDSRLPGGPRWPVRDADAELAWTLTWTTRLRGWVDDAFARRVAAAASLAAAALSDRTGGLVPIHADLHDGQVVLAADGQVGLLDWDTLSWGEAAVDLANLLVHLEVAAHAGACCRDGAETVGAAVLTGYGADLPLRRRVAAYVGAVRVRLATLCVFRPARAAVASALLERPCAPPPGLFS